MAVTTVEGSTTIKAEDKRLLGKVKNAIQGVLPTATILLYGSASRGTRTSESDYDILVLSDNSLTVKEQSVVRDALFDIELETGAVICTLFYAKDEWESPLARVSPFHREVERDAVVL